MAEAIIARRGGDLNFEDCNVAVATFDGEAYRYIPDEIDIEDIKAYILISATDIFTMGLYSSDGQPIVVKGELEMIDSFIGVDAVSRTLWSSIAGLIDEADMRFLIFY